MDLEPCRWLGNGVAPGLRALMTPTRLAELESQRATTTGQRVRGMAQVCRMANRVALGMPALTAPTVLAELESQRATTTSQQVRGVAQVCRMANREAFAER
jgi:hypothetical protein